MKKCFKCGKIKSLSEFYVHKQMGDGHLGKCKDCAKKDVKNNHRENRDYYTEYDKYRQRHNFRRMFLSRYGNMLQRIEGRATRKYRVAGKDICSKESFLKWCYLPNNLDAFTILHYQWEKNGFVRGLAPSIDRKDNNQGYNIKNIQWITQRDNTIKFYKTQ